MNGLEKVCVLNEKFNQILTTDRIFYLSRIPVRDENKTQTILERKKSSIILWHNLQDYGASMWWERMPLHEMLNYIIEYSPAFRNDA